MMALTPARKRFLDRQAARMREKPADIELRLWNRLKNRQLYGLWFTHQEVVACYILDFYCEGKGLAVEVDGSAYHGWKSRAQRDAKKDFELEQLGVRVLRFTAAAVEKDLAFLIDRIALAARVGRFAHVSTGKGLKSTSLVAVEMCKTAKPEWQLKQEAARTELLGRSEGTNGKRNEAKP